MPLRYLDTTYNYSDPANTNLKYLKRVVDPDGTIHAEWMPPTDDAEFWDADGHWSVPELGLKPGSWDDYTWEKINDFGQKKVLVKPEKYSGLIHTTKTVPIADPVNKSIVYEIVDICHTDWGNDNAFVWMPKEECLMEMQYYHEMRGMNSYYDSGIRRALLPNGTLYNAYPSDLKTEWKNINYKYLRMAKAGPWEAYGDPTTESANLVIPAIVEINAVPNGRPNYNVEGTAFQAFASGAIKDLIRNGDGAAVRWWTRTLSSQSNMGTGSYSVAVLESGSVFYSDQPATFWVCPCFCV